MDSRQSKLKDNDLKKKLLLDANIVNYAINGEKATGENLLDYINGLQHIADWFIASCTAVSLYNNNVYPKLITKILNCDAPPMKIDSWPYMMPDGRVVTLRLNSLSGDDWAQIQLAREDESIIIVTNDKAMFKSAHFILNGRVITFHELLKQMSPLYYPNKQWIKLKLWLQENSPRIEIKSSWKNPK